MEAPLSRPRAHALLHLTVFAWGLTAILGKSIRITALPLVFYRVTLVTALMALFLFRKGISFRVPLRRAAELAATGTLVALHWVLFYAAIKHAGVAVAVLCLSTITFFTALLEPLAFRRRVRRHEIILGALVIAGVLMLLRFEVHATAEGFAMGLGSAFFSAAFGTWNGRLAAEEAPERVTLYELGAAGVACAATFSVVGGFVPPWEVSAHDWALLALLGVACTLLPWLWALRVLKTLSPYTVAISVSLEPVYSLAFAYVLWPEEERATPRFYVGAALLIVLIISNGIIKSRNSVPTRPMRR